MEGHGPLLSLRSRVSLALVLTLVGIGVMAAQPPAAAAPTDVDGQRLALHQPIQATGSSESDELAFTGSSDSTPWLVGGSLAAMLVGATLMYLTARREPVLVEMRSLRPIEPVRSRPGHRG